MIKPEQHLMAGGVVSTLISILHFILALKPALYRHVSAGQESVLPQMAEQGSRPTTVATVALALIFTIWAAYAFSGAGLIYPLPLLRAALISIAVIYICAVNTIPVQKLGGKFWTRKFCLRHYYSIAFLNIIGGPSNNT